MSIAFQESQDVSSFRSWLFDNGAKIHESLYFFPDSSGLSVRTHQLLPPGTEALSCPFSLAITLENIEEALEKLCYLSSEERRQLTPRQLICTYIALHYVTGETEDENSLLRHRPYIRILPKSEKLVTPLQFTDGELELFKGTNLFNAAVDQRKTCMNEYRHLHEVIREHASDIAGKFTFEMFKTAWAYLLSRAFPSTLLSITPSLETTPSSYPVLIPGIDMFNHKRAQPVSWSVSRTETSHLNHNATTKTKKQKKSISDLYLSLVIETHTAEGGEVFNNYGPKPNSSLIMGYGFALRDNPDDTILLKIGSSSTSTSSTSDDDGDRSGSGHEVGRDASGAQALWDDVRRRIVSVSVSVSNRADGVSYKDEEYAEEEEGEEEGEEEEEEANAAKEIQIDIETADTLSTMISSLIHRLPNLNVNDPQDRTVREEVLTMRRYYVKGQEDILEALLIWLEEKEKETERRAEELGICISTVGELDDSEEEIKE